MDMPYTVKAKFALFSSDERQALYQIMCGVMICDGTSDPREKQAIGEINQAMNLTQADIAASRNRTQDYMISVIRRMPEEKRFLVARAISTVALADGPVNPMEDSFAAYMANQLKLNLDWF